MAVVIAALCRHGSYEQPDDTPSAHLLHPLTAQGEDQARQLGRDLSALAATRGWTIDPVIDTSSLQRAYQTGQLASAELNRAGGEWRVETFGALMERSVGAAANLTLGEIERILTGDPRFGAPPADWKSRSDYRLPVPGAESLLEAGRRCAAHLRARAAALRAGPKSHVLKVFVGHGAAFRHAAVTLGALSLEDVGTVSMYHARAVCLTTDPLGPWTLAAGEWKPRDRAQAPD